MAIASFEEQLRDKQADLGAQNAALFQKQVQDEVDQLNDRIGPRAIWIGGGLLGLAGAASFWLMDRRQKGKNSYQLTIDN